MISRIGLAVSRVFQKTAPDPFVIAIGLTVLTAILAFFFGDYEIGPGETRLGAMIDAWRDPGTGLWRFLAFGMQMCLILVTGHALASTRPIRRGIDALARVPQGTAGAAGLVSIVACVAGIMNWGLGLIVGALLAREVGRSMRSRGLKSHYPLLCAAGYTPLLLWHGGFSGSAPLTMTSVSAAEVVIDRNLIDRVREAQGTVDIDGAVAPLTHTILSGQNILITGGLLILVPILLMLMAPKREQDLQPMEDFPDAEAASRRASDEDDEASVPAKMNNSLTIALLLALALLWGFWRFLTDQGIGALGLNEVNTLMFALGMILHGSPAAYMNAVSDAARGCAGIIIQFPLYGGIMGMMHAGGLVESLAQAFARAGTETTMPLLSFFAAAIVNLFVPSGGGQWAIQGPVALEAGMAVGVEPSRMIMAVAYGDQLTNMLQPFWALPLLGVTGVKARDIVGYTAVVMVIAALWMMLGLLIFT